MDKQIVLVIGGPGKSGSSTIAKMLADYFQLELIQGGKAFKEIAKGKEFNSLEDFYRYSSPSEILKIDKEVDDRLRSIAKRGNVIIDSKVFAALSTIENIPCSAKVWIDASLDVRVKRAFEKEVSENDGKLINVLKKYEIRRNLSSRYKYDRRRYKNLYGIDYDHQEKYNDLVIDNSDQSPDQTFNLIIKFLKDAGIKK
ncbi:MAG: (d)CMP kinase [Candidatus Dojkabacteria bacterium]|nr:(d)CMP kinase [Candidatus Dojkabacteria bacterium]